ncbi:uncharacterized protein Dana_GF12157 [Drosophila ananassae]|uniref:Uncharacterized protein n=1 Tax=Drosophila ananassae TaxID=7217 RepID=B3MBB9_DROAN|nr:bomanin-836 [Drosophila ananassae]EDV36044.1 uncharacterized protein Dana_GF12157 [Drosophila ananassae]
MKPLQFVPALLVLFCLLAVANATPGKVYINGKCIDCNKPDNDDSIVIPMERAGSASYTLTSGAMVFGIIYYVLSLVYN